MAETHNTEMYDLLAKHFAGETDAGEVTRLLAWKNASPANAADFDEAARLWAAADAVDWQDASAFDAENAWDDLQFRLPDAQDPSPEKFRIFSLKVLSRVAAVLIVAAIGSFVAWYLGTRTEDIMKITCHGDNIEKVLTDSSSVTLKDNSELAWSQNTFGLKDRRVTFHGTGYFKIASDTEKPFIVDLHGVNVKVVGTEFNIESPAGSDTATVSVIKGTVLLYDSLGHRVIVTAGRQGLYSRKNAVLISRNSTNKNTAAWKTKTLIFERTEISEVIRVLEMVYSAKISVKKEKINNCRITATFSNEKLDSVIRIIAETFNMTVIQQDDKYILDGDGC